MDWVASGGCGEWRVGGGMRVGEGMPVHDPPQPRHTGTMRARIFVPLVAAALLLSACAPTTASPAPSRSDVRVTASPPLEPLQTPTPTPTDPIAGLTLAQRVGQLFMVGTPRDAAAAGSLKAIAARHVGSVFLHSSPRAGADQTAAVVQKFRNLVSPQTTGGVPLWVATDQEGGDVQVLNGAGFDPIPSALKQGGMPPATLQQDAATWASQLRAAGVDMNLAPVADIVTSAAVARQNKPIGLLNRQYGYDEKAVAAGAGAFAAGMREGGVMPTFKHFPGLGRTTSNTDFAPAFDSVITASSPDVDVYRSLLARGPALVMLSTAVYKKIDPSAPAAFSSKIVTGILRDELGFDGVVITDDLSAAAAVSAFTPAARAIKAIQAGCDIVLVSSGPTLLPEMYDAVLAKATSDPAFAAEVDAAARRVVVAKQLGVG